MSVAEPNTIDIISIDKEGRVALTITDHLSWDDDNHLLILEKKLNAYLRFVESGEVYQKYPDAERRAFLFRISFKFRPSINALDFLSRVKKIIEDAGFQFEYEVFAASYDN